MHPHDACQQCIPLQVSPVPRSRARGPTPLPFRLIPPPSIHVLRRRLRRRRAFPPRPNSRRPRRPSPEQQRFSSRLLTFSTPLISSLQPAISVANPSASASVRAPTSHARAASCSALVRLLLSIVSLADITSSLHLSRALQEARAPQGLHRCHRGPAAPDRGSRGHYARQQRRSCTVFAP